MTHGIPNDKASLNHEKAELANMIGRRMEAARRLSHLTQDVAAHRLGYNNSSKLSKIEKSSDTMSVPNYIICRAAKLYDVTTDYLYGLSDDWEPSTPRDVNMFIAQLMEKTTKQNIQAMAQLSNKVRLVTELVELIGSETLEVKEALDSFCAMHPEIEDMRASRLISSINRAYHSGKEANNRLARFKKECREHSVSDENQLKLELTEERG